MAWRLRRKSKMKVLKTLRFLPAAAAALFVLSAGAGEAEVRQDAKAMDVLNAMAAYTAAMAWTVIDLAEEGLWEEL